MVIIPIPTPITVGQLVPELGRDGWVVGVGVIVPEQTQLALFTQDGLRQTPW